MLSPKVWVILLTAMFPGNGEFDHKIIVDTCPRYHCVEQMIAEASTSTHVSRIRVFRPGEFGGLLILGLTPFPAYIDLQFQ